MSSCNGNCSSCGSDCSDRKAESLLASLNPKSSVKNGQVYVVKNGKAKAVAVSGKRVNEYFEVKSGVKAGQQIVTNPDSKLHNGTKVSADGND